MTFDPRFTVTNAMTADLTRSERARGFLEAATLSEDWIRRIGERALILEAHHTMHIEGTGRSLAGSERLLAGTTIVNSSTTGTRFAYVSTWLGSGRWADGIRDAEAEL